MDFKLLIGVDSREIAEKLAKHLKSKKCITHYRIVKGTLLKPYIHKGFYIKINRFYGYMEHPDIYKVAVNYLKYEFGIEV
jgi:hypothetical protein